MATTRLAGITAVYALIAALLLVTPLSASEEPARGESAAQPGSAPLGSAAPGGAQPGAG